MKLGDYKWAIVEDVIIGVGCEGEMPDDTWRSFIDDLSTKPVTKYLSVISGDLQVNSAQRKLGIDAVLKRKIKVVAVIDSSVVRGILTAASWFGLNIKAYPHAQLREAIQDLDVRAPLVLPIVREVERLRKQLA
jgi:hypothetical protein